MRAVIVALAAVLAMTTIGTAGGASWAGQDAWQADEILAGARRALGADEAVVGFSALFFEGSFRRVMGPREVDGTFAITLGLAGQIRHEEEMRLPGGGGATRVAGLNGDHVWEDTATRSGVGGQIVIRGFGPGPGGRDADPEQVRQTQQRRLATMYERMTLALLASGDDLSYAGVADVGDGRAHVLEKLDPAGHPIRLFVREETYMPIGVSFMELRFGMGAGGGAMMGPGGPPGQPRGGAQSGRMIQTLPPSTIIMRLEDYRRVDGLLLPHLFVHMAEGEPVEEWTIARYQLNPRLDAGVFDRK